MKRIAVSLFLFFALAAFANAATIVFIGDPNGAAAPYTLTINGVTVTGDCISDDLSVAGTWQATETSVVDFSNIVSGTGQTETQLLEQAVWLDQRFGLPGWNTTNVQDAIWDIGQKISGVPLGFTDATTNSYLSLSFTNFAATSQNVYAGYSLLIPDGGNSASPDNWPKGVTGESQFFLIPGPPTSSQTPEPATYLMTGGALIGFGMYLKKRSKA